MSDEDDPQTFIPVAAIPSRAGTAPAQPLPPYESAIGSMEPQKVQRPLPPLVEQIPSRPRGRPRKTDQYGDPIQPKERTTRKKTMTKTEKKREATALRRGPGRPPGSKNKPKLETAKRGPGRPSGSRNGTGKNQIETALQIAANLTQEEFDGLMTVVKMPRKAREKVIAALSQVYG